MNIEIFFYNSKYHRKFLCLIKNKIYFLFEFVFAL